MRIKTTTIGALAGLSMAVGASAATLDYPNFSGDVSGLQINGNAAIAGSVLRVTPAVDSQSGSVFSKTAIELNNLKQFSTRFQFEITQSGGVTDNDGSGADGLTFAVQTVANTAGGGGGGIGYQGLSPSVVVEMDTYNNGAQDQNDGNHVGIAIDGDVFSKVQQGVADRFNNDAIWTAWVDYNGSTLEVRLNETGTRPASALLSYNVDLASVLGTPDAFVGFTSGTGGAWGNHDVLNWEFRDTYNPIPGVPEAGSTLVMLALGCLGLRGCSRFAKGRK